MRSVVRPGLRAARTRLATHAAAPVRLCSSSAPSSSDSTSPPSIVERASKLFEQPAARKAGSEKMLDKMREGTGWREALESGLYEQQKMQRQDDVREQLNKMASMESFGFDELAGQLRHSLEQLEQGMTTFQRARLFADKMSGGNTSDNIEQQKAKAISKLKILDELNPHEKRKPKLLDPPARRAIAAKLGIEVRDIDELLFEYQLQRAQWTFLRREALRGREVPQSPDELEWRMKTKPTREFVHVMRAFERRKEEMESERNPPRRRRNKGGKRFGWGESLSESR